MQQRKTGTTSFFEQVFSTNLLIAARSKGVNTKVPIPAIDLSYSDEELQATQRKDLALASNQLYREYNPREQESRAPDDEEFDLIQKMYQVELEGGPAVDEKYVDMELTKVKQTSIIHRDSAHAGGRIFGGQLLNKSI